MYADWVVGALERGAYLGVLVEADGRVVAGAGLTLLDWGPTKHDPHPLRGRIVNVYTVPHLRGRGLARLAVERVLREAHDLGLRTLSLGTTEAARPMYISLGFAPYPHEMMRRE
ncbi:hypothetical protein Dcar01_01171 [Deinococcus carri]|uniref:N-acetyltransferase domain-containing protein n=1 Tax=Deinococcus carri TaxID=1211323 RepID=A0ABP9W530_9DEIO